MSRYIVIGGAGFIGINTAKELANRGHEVTLVDRVRLEIEHENIQCSVIDIHDMDALKSLMPGADGVFHFAAIADIADALLRPYETIQTNVMGTVNVLEAMLQAGVRRLMYASTMYVYSPYGGSIARASRLLRPSLKPMAMKRELSTQFCGTAVCTAPVRRSGTDYADM